MRVCHLERATRPLGADVEPQRVAASHAHALAARVHGQGLPLRCGEAGV